MCREGDLVMNVPRRRECQPVSVLVNLLWDDDRHDACFFCHAAVGRRPCGYMSSTVKGLVLRGCPLLDLLGDVMVATLNLLRKLVQAR